MLTYYDWDGSPNCLKTKILLLELGLEYEERRVDRETLASAAYRAKFPTGYAPAIEQDDFRLAESAAIALYLCGTNGAKLIPKDAHRRGRMYQGIELEGTLLAPTVGAAGLFGELGKPEAARDPARVAELRKKAQQVGEILGAVLGDREYFADELTIADIQLYPAVAKSIEARVFEAPANLTAWYERMSARPSVQAARKQYVHYR